MIGYSKAKRYGRPYRGAYDGEGTGAGYGASSESTAPDTPAPAVSAPAVVAEFAGSPVGSLTGGNLATGTIGFGFAPGPVAAIADAQIVDPGPDTPSPVQTVVEAIKDALLPIEKVEIAPQPVASVTLTRSTAVDFGQLLNNAASTALSLLGIASGTPSGVIGGGRGLAGVVSAPSAFSEVMTETVSMPGPMAQTGGGETFGGSPAPSVFASGEGRTAEAGSLGSSPVLGFGGAIVNDAPQATTTGAGLGGLPAALAGLFAQPANTRQRYAASVGGQQQQAAPAIPPALALAGLAGLIFLG